MRLKDGHTYITRSGVKRKVKLAHPGCKYSFSCAQIGPSGEGNELHTEQGKWWEGEKHPWDFVKEVKKNAK